MGQVSTIPTYDQQLTEGDNTSKVWYRFLKDLWQGVPPASETKISPIASPYSYQATQRGFVIVQGGTVSMVQWSRTTGTNRATGAIQGTFPLSAGDNLIITYSAVPTVTFVPQ